MTFISFRNTIAAFGLLTVIALVPTTASARSSVHVDIPGFSIGFHDRNRYGWRQNRRHSNRHSRRNHSYDYGHRNYGSGYYDRSYRGYGYAPRSYRGYGNAPRSGYYGRDVCPIAGYSPYGYRDRGCYAHKDHFHCND